MATQQELEQMRDEALAMWNINETSGNTILDATDNNNDITFGSDISLITGLIGSALNLQGSGNSVNYNTRNILNYSQQNAVTLSAWVFYSGGNSGGSNRDYGIIINLQESDNSGMGRTGIAVNNNRDFRFRVRGGTQTTLGDKIELNEWTHLALTFDGSSNAKAYINAVDVGEIPVGNNTLSTSLNIGVSTDQSSSFTPYFVGLIDMPLILPFAANQAQIEAIYNNGNGLQFPFTQINIPIITTNSADQITHNTARLNGELEDLAEISEVVTFFQYREVGSGTWLETDGNTRTSPTTFNETISSLSPDTEYEFRSVAEWDDGNSMEQNFGDTLTFTTLEAPAENFQITIVSTNSPVNQGQTLNVVVDVENTGNDDGTQDITLRFGTQGNIVDTQNLTVNEGQTERITLSYSIPSGQSPDTYNIWVQSDDDTVTDTIEVQESQVSINYIKPLEAQEFNGFTVEFEYEIDTNGTTGTAYLFINKPTSSPNSEADKVDVIETAGVHTITHTIEDVGEDFSSSNSNTYFVRYIEDEEE